MLTMMPITPADAMSPVPTASSPRTRVSAAATAMIAMPMTSTRRSTPTCVRTRRARMLSATSTSNRCTTTSSSTNETAISTHATPAMSTRCSARSPAASSGAGTSGRSAGSAYMDAEQREDEPYRPARPSEEHPVEDEEAWRPAGEARGAAVEHRVQHEPEECREEQRRDRTPGGRQAREQLRRAHRSRAST